MKTAKLGALFMVSLMAIAGVGASYAVWSDQVAITATATTGYLEYRITDFSVSDQTLIAGQPATWTGVGTYPEWDSITITVQPTYPGWAAICHVTVKNTGTLPLTMYSMKMTYVSGEWDLMNYYYWAIPDAGYNTLPIDPTHIYWLNTFNWWTTGYTYAALGIPTITILPGATKTLDAYFWLNPALTGWENTPLTVTITLEATTAAIAP